MNRALSGCIAATMLFALPVQATTLTATAATLKTVFASAKAGDTIRLTGSFSAVTLANRRFASAVTLDARAATFIGLLAITSVGGLTVLGGHYGSSTSLLSPAIRVGKSDRITFSAPVVVGNRTSGHGIDVGTSSSVTIDSGSFSGLKLGVGFIAVSGGTLSRNTSRNSTSDGFNVADSHNVLVSGNSCSGTVIAAGAHPDCVQLWSVAGHAVQSDIQISDNIATGATQGFTSFNPENGGGLRIAILRNRVDTSYPQGIACYGCIDSRFEGNILTTQPGAQWQTSINIVGGRNNLVHGNSVGAFAKPLAAMAFDEEAAAPSWQDSWSLADQTEFAAASVPEPGVWVLLITGFGMAGTALRRRRVIA